MKDKIYLLSPQFVSEKIDKIIAIPGEIRYTCRLGLFCGLREQEIFYIKEKPICYQAYGCDKLHVVNCKSNDMTVIAIGCSRGNKKAIATVLPTNYWEKLLNMPRFDRYDVQAAHRILRREANIAFIVMRKIHYNVMRFKDTMNSYEAYALAGRVKTTSAQHYVLHDLKSFSDKYVKACDNF